MCITKNNQEPRTSLWWFRFERTKYILNADLGFGDQNTSFKFERTKYIHNVDLGFGDQNTSLTVI